MYSLGQISCEQDDLMFDLLSRHRRLRLFEQAVKREPSLNNLSTQVISQWYESRTQSESSHLATHQHHQQQQQQQAHFHECRPFQTTMVHYDSGFDRQSPPHSSSSSSSSSSVVPGGSAHSLAHTAALARPAAAPGLGPAPVPLRPVAHRTLSSSTYQPTTLLHSIPERQSLNIHALEQPARKDDSMQHSTRQRDLGEMQRRVEREQRQRLEQHFIVNGLNLRVKSVQIRNWLRLNQPQRDEPLEVKLVSALGGTIICTTVYKGDRYSLHIPLRSLVAISFKTESIILQTCERPSFHVQRRGSIAVTPIADFTTDQSASQESQHLLGVASTELVVVRAQLEQLTESLPLLRVLLFPRPLAALKFPSPIPSSGRGGPSWSSLPPTAVSSRRGSLVVTPPRVSSANGLPPHHFNAPSAAGARILPQAAIGNVGSAPRCGDLGQVLDRPAQRAIPFAGGAPQQLRQGVASPSPSAFYRPSSMHDVTQLATPPSPCKTPTSDMFVSPTSSPSSSRHSRTPSFSPSSTSSSEKAWDMFMSPWKPTLTPTTASSTTPPNVAESSAESIEQETTPRPQPATLGVIGEQVLSSPTQREANNAQEKMYTWSPFFSSSAAPLEALAASQSRPKTQSSVASGSAAHGHRRRADEAKVAFIHEPRNFQNNENLNFSLGLGADSWSW